MAHQSPGRPVTGGSPIPRRTLLGMILAAGVVAPLIGTGTAARADSTTEDEYDIPDGIGSTPWW